MQGFSILLLFVEDVRKEYSGDRTKYVTISTLAFSTLGQLLLSFSRCGLVYLLV